MKIIIGNAWPYANGPLHLGRIAVLMPGDVIARYHRLMEDEVIFLSGTDCHGLPVLTKAKEESITPEETVLKYHEEFIQTFKALDFSFDIFSKTTDDLHKDNVKEFILELMSKNFIYEKGEGAEKHLYFRLSEFKNDITRLLIRQKNWRENAITIVKRYLDEGLRDKAVTRDIKWGIEVPLEGFDDKRIYVWIEAVMGYVTSTIKALENKNDTWKDYWMGEDTKIYFVHGKDNIPFHTVIFPSILSGLGVKNPNLQIVSSEYMKLEGKAFSTVKNWAVWAKYAVENYGSDCLRYYLLFNSPENKDTDFKWKDFINTVNKDLNKLINAYINNVFYIFKNEYTSELDKETIRNEFKNYILDVYFEVGDSIEGGKFKDGIFKILNLIKKESKRLEEYRNLKSNKEINQLLFEQIQVVANLSVLLDPFTPKAAKILRDRLNIDNPIWSYNGINKILDLSYISLYEKIDFKNITIENKRLKEEKIDIN